MQFSGLICGLGNPGQKYENTRHNIGFMALDALMKEAERIGFPVANVKKDKNYQLWECRLGSSRWLLVKPLTYMNRSGQAVAAVCNFYKLAPRQILVVHDELDLPFGKMKLKSGGGLAGHNGLKSIAADMGSQDFFRLRIGIDRPAPERMADYVLSPFSKEESSHLAQLVEAAADGIICFTENGYEATAARVNSFNIV